MPVLDVRRNHDDAALVQADRRLALFLIPAFACGAEQQLTAARSRVMDVPVVAAARLKGDVRREQTGLGVGQRVQKRVADEKLGVGGIGRTRAELVCSAARLRFRRIFVPV